VPDPIYTVENCTPAYQLAWSYSAFWREPPASDVWLSELQAACEPDDIRILQHRFAEPTVSQFLVSTRPHVQPLVLVQRLKGRLQHLFRGVMSEPFRRNYSLRSIGSPRREALEGYLAGQIEHHPPADARVSAELAEHQINDPQVDLAAPSTTSHARYWYNLHLVLVNDGRARELTGALLRKIHDMVVQASAKKGHGLAHAAILPDHLHLALRCHLEESPAEVAVSYMNNLAYACGMRPVFKFSYYVGTFSEYGLGLIPRA
jgi:hypothetical protein